MFVGLSKNLGGGFRVGIGTRINLDNNKSNKKDEQQEEFINFINSMNDKILESIKIFIETNGYNFQELSRYEIDLDNLFLDSKKYDELIEISKEVKRVIERTIEIKDYGVVAKRKVSEEVYKLVDFVEDYKKNFNIYLEQGLATNKIEIDYGQYKLAPIQKEDNQKPISALYKIFIYLGVLILPFIFAWFTLKKGFSKTSRIISFIWLGLFLFSMANGIKKDNLNNANTTPTTTNQEVKTK